MIVKELFLKDFRNYENQSISFSPDVNVIYGDNAQGKTNILEAVYLFAMGKSNRTYHDEELIRFGMPFANVKMKFLSGDRELVSEINIKKGKRKSILINEIPIKKNSDLVGRFKVVYFGPECMDLVKSGPKSRRKNFDVLISQLHKNYFKNLSDYKKLLDSKTALLKAEKRDFETLDIINEQIAAVSVEIMKYRFSYIKKIENISKEIQNEISGSTENIEISYNSSVGIIEQFDEKEAAALLREKIDKNKRREIEFRECLTGPHRDDIEYLINGRKVKIFGSSGQQKTVSLVQKIAEVSLIFKETGEYPVLLLDDIMSELDKSRQKYILNKIRGMQIIITCTDKDGFEKIDKINEIKVSKGRIV